MKKEEKISRILIAVEDSPYSDLAVGYGMMLAKQFDAMVAMVHADEIPVNAPFVSDPMLGETPLMVPEMMNIQEEASKNLFKRIDDQFVGEKRVKKFIRVGRAQDEILAVAKEFKADLIILGTHGRTGLDHFISGSVSESVAKRATCPVLIIPKPESK